MPAHAADRRFEFHNTILYHDFLTIDPAEAAAIDSGAAGPGWVRTQKNIGAYRSGDDAPPGTREVCRFYGNQANGEPNSHFYTAEPAECKQVNPPWAPGWDRRRWKRPFDFPLPASQSLATYVATKAHTSNVVPIRKKV
jgi:hypothetical protein